MKRSIKAIAAALAAITAMLCTPVMASATSFKTIKGVLYTVSDDGKQMSKYTGWVRRSDGRYYYNKGVSVKKSWLKVNGRLTYYLDKNGKAAVGDVRMSDGKFYHFDEKGKLQYGLRITAESASDTIIRESLKGLFLYDGKLRVLSNTPFRVEKQDKDGNWTEMPLINPDEPYKWSGELIEYFAGMGSNTYNESHSVYWLYGRLPAGNYRFSRYYYVLSGSTRVYLGTIYAPFTVKKKRTFSEEELLSVYRYLEGNKGRYDLSNVYIDEDSNYVVAVGHAKNRPFLDYISTLDDPTILCYIL